VCEAAIGLCLTGEFPGAAYWASIGPSLRPLRPVLSFRTNVRNLSVVFCFYRPNYWISHMRLRWHVVYVRDDSVGYHG